MSEREDERAPEIPPGRNVPVPRTTRPARPQLTDEQRAEAERIYADLLVAAADDLRALAELLATRTDATMFGATEFAVRDLVLRVGAKALQSALDGRKKGGTTGPVAVAPPALAPPSSSAGNPRRS
jgi:hypothetical protein